MNFARQLRGETRKLVHPLSGLALAVVAAATSALQAEHISDPYPGPSIRDVAGCVRIAFLQHATTLGFFLAGVLAAVGTADDAGRGALADMLIREPRRSRVAAIKLATVLSVQLFSVAVTTVTLLITRSILAAEDTRAPATSASPPLASLIDVSTALPVIVLAAALALTLALLTRSVIATAIVTVTLFYLPLTLLRNEIFWATPTRWTVEWLHLDPLGQGIDYLADNSPYDRRGTPALVCGLLIFVAELFLIAVLPVLISRAAQRANERNA